MTDGSHCKQSYGSKRFAFPFCAGSGLMREERCLYCKVALEKEEQQHFLPFCSQRCRLLDLGAWLDEDYVIATATADEDELP